MEHHPLPSGWRKVSLEDIAHVQTGLAIGKAVNGDSVTMPYLRVANVQDGYLDLSEVKEIVVSSRDVERFSLQHEDVLMTEGGDFDKLGRGCVWESPIPKCLHQNHVFAVRTHRDKLLPRFFAYHAASPAGRLYFLSCSKQSTNLASINSTQLKQMPVPLPPLVEQKAIAGVLSAWDRAIEQTTALIAAKERLKQGLMQQLLTGKRRFRGFEGDWRRGHLGDVAHESTKRNECGLPIEAVHSVTKANGMVPMPEDTVGADLSRYKLVHPKAFAYNPMRINIGSIARWDGDGEVLVSPDYVVFECEPDLDPDFLNHLRRSHRWDSYVKRSGDGSVRVRIYFDDLSRMPILLPGIDEQRRIAGVLNAANMELGFLQRRLSGLKSQKRGLMQQLLTGTVRVPPSLLKKGAAS